jgi:hypothetical protein
MKVEAAPMAVVEAEEAAAQAAVSAVVPAADAAMGDGGEGKEEVAKEDPAKMRVVDLRAALEKRGLDTGGLKKVLQGRLQEALDKE